MTYLTASGDRSTRVYLSTWRLLERRNATIFGLIRLSVASVI